LRAVEGRPFGGEDMTAMVRNVTTVAFPLSDEGAQWIAPKRSSGGSLPNGSNRPITALQDSPYERAESARKRSSTEGVGCASCCHQAPFRGRGKLCNIRSRAARAPVRPRGRRPALRGAAQAGWSFHFS
jgi:hypothetical protein